MLQLDGISWIVSELGKHALLLEPKIENGKLEKIHRVYQLLEMEQSTLINDVVPAYQSIAIFYDTAKKDVLNYLELLRFSTLKSKSSKTIEVEVNYDQGLDWNRVTEETGLTKSEIIERHSKPVYTIAMIGFVPGFIFLEGLQPELAVPRMETPRITIPAGSIGIGGNQTGIYSIESPGGWNIIGNSNHRFFDIQRIPPNDVTPGDMLKFIPL